MNVNDFYDHLNDGTCIKRFRRDDEDELISDINSTTQIKLNEKIQSNEQVQIIQDLKQEVKQLKNDLGFKESILEEMNFKIEKLQFQRDEALLSIDRLKEEINQINVKNQIQEESYNIEIESLKTEIKYYLEKMVKAESNCNNSMDEYIENEEGEINKCEEDEEDDYSRNRLLNMHQIQIEYSNKNKNHNNNYIEKEIDSLKHALNHFNK